MKLEKIYFWPQWFAESLSSSKRLPINSTLISKLGRANLYLWRALNIYDDFLDGAGQRAKLPQANNYYRRYLEIYYRLNLDPSFYRLFNRVMIGLDTANRQETLKNHLKITAGKINLSKRLPRFNKFSNLAKKSLALGLGAIAILYILKRPRKKLEIEATLNFFRYALAAKQLSDDSRDWFEDLTDGRITAANVLVLRAAKRRRLKLDLNHQPEIAHLLFAIDAAAKICRDLKKLCQQAKIYGTKINLDPDSRLITEIIGPLETGLVETTQFNSYWAKDPKKML